MPNFTQDRDNTIKWARSLLQQDFVVLDTETTGLGDNDEAVAIGVVDKNGNVLLDTLLHHTKHSSPEALATHGITWEMTRDAPLFAEVYPVLLKLLDAHVTTYNIPEDAIYLNQIPIVAYNAYFDARILEQTAERYGLVPLRSTNKHDVMSQFAAFYGEWNEYHGNYKWQKLTTAACHLCYFITDAHSAANDALTTLRVVEGMAKAKLRGEE